MKIDYQQMEKLFDKVLAKNEKSLCPICCFFESSAFTILKESMNAGFVTCTDRGRILIARYSMAKESFIYNSFSVYHVTNIRAKKTVFDQYNIIISFKKNNIRSKFRFVVSPEMSGMSFPEQEINTKKFLFFLRKYT